MDATCLCSRTLLEISADRALSEPSKATHWQGGYGVLRGYGMRNSTRASLKVRTLSKLLRARSRVHFTSIFPTFGRRSYIYHAFPDALDGEQELQLWNSPSCSATDDFVQQRRDCHDIAKALRQDASESLAEKASVIDSDRELHPSDASTSATEEPRDNYENAKALKDTEESVMEKENIDDTANREHMLSYAPSSVTGSFLQHHDSSSQDKEMDNSDEAAEQDSPGTPNSAKEDFLQHHGCNGEVKALGKDALGSVTKKTKVMDTNRTLEPGYVGLFVRLLGLDNRAEDRESAVQALWRHSKGGRNCVDEIMQFPGCLTLVVSLLVSERLASVEAAAGLLQNISVINVYGSAIADAGAIEEITGILARQKITSVVTS